MPLPLSAIGDNGQPVDWWFMYKVPKNAGPAVGTGPMGHRATGYEYAYFDDQSATLSGSRNLLSAPNNALTATLQQVFEAAANPTSGCIFYNDEFPLELNLPNNGGLAHAKGVLAFDLGSDSAFWLLHSIPRFSHPTSGDFPSNELDYGQTLLCITLKDVATAEAIAQQMLVQQGPQVYGTRLPQSLPPDSVWHKLAAGDFSLSHTPSDIPFTSKGGATFRSIAKSRLWGQDLWSDLVGPSLGVDLDVESWRRGAIPSGEDSNKTEWVADDTAIDLNPIGMPFAWQNAKDHAKWAMSLENNDDWVCVADINRQVSQAKRGGGTICFQDSRLWAGLSAIAKAPQGGSA
ncbi:MAG: deoxyribonuclease II family protein [Chloroflexota bacterium]|nr:deoxyribonuclease II family protein [Chloroflexota bacterium]MDQ5864694.1 deoxyribonuclease II family protein [Chloroflexota bacterium]